LKEFFSVWPLVQKQPFVAVVAVTFTVITLFMVRTLTSYPLYGIPRFFSDYRVMMIIVGEFILSKY
jgi:hypothetical protein